MAGEACLHQSLAAIGLAVFKLTVAPAARVGVFLRILDTELSVCGGSGDEGLGLPEDGVVFVRGDVFPSQSSDDRAVREGARSIFIGLDRDVVSENGAKIVEAACFVSHADHLPVAIAGRYPDAENGRGLVVAASGGERCQSAGICGHRPHGRPHACPTHRRPPLNSDPAGMDQSPSYVSLVNSAGLMTKLPHLTS